MTRGMKSSEFWVSNVFPGLIVIANSVFGWGIDYQTLLGMFGLSGMYTYGRSKVKASGFQE